MLHMANHCILHGKVPIVIYYMAKCQSSYITWQSANCHILHGKVPVVMHDIYVCA